jgi:hypothetical protein
VQHALESGQTARAIFDHEVRDGHAHFEQQRCGDQRRPGAVPLAPGKREEDEGVDEFPQGMQRQFVTRGAACRQALGHLVVPDGVQRA